MERLWRFNIGKFPNKYMFQLTEDEYYRLRSQNVTLKNDFKQRSGSDLSESSEMHSLRLCAFARNFFVFPQISQINAD